MTRPALQVLENTVSVTEECERSTFNPVEIPDLQQPIPVLIDRLRDFYDYLSYPDIRVLILSGHLCVWSRLK